MRETCSLRPPRLSQCPLAQLEVLSSIQPREKLPFDVVDADHDLAWPAVARLDGAVNLLQLLSVFDKFCCESFPVAALHVTLPFADVVVSREIVLDVAHYPIWVQS